MSAKWAATNRGNCNHVILLGNNGKNVVISTLLNPDLGKHAKDESTSKEYLVTTAFNPRQCNFCKRVKVLGEKEEQDQCKKTDKKGDSTKSTVGPVGFHDEKKVLNGKELARSLGFIEGQRRSIIPHKPCEGSREWQDDAAWEDSPMCDPKSPPLMEYLHPTPSCTPDPHRTRGKAKRKALARKKREGRARRLMKNQAKELLKFKVRTESIDLIYII